ncbi:hypothetical protein M9H77_22893 [Catharanthus roseus]|uniref:Uncharacterized protein n=1 Tax=Catharanthus roseus TaxID=4058 RepID=A0ACC0AT95_CATRO|nr:hypothetical protein M9H77_22893 [Catharanthus roseus]
MTDFGLSGMTRSIRLSVRKSKDEATRVLASIRRVLAHSLSGNVSCAELTSLTRSFIKSFTFIEKGTRRRDKFCKLKEENEHEHRTISVPMATDHRLMLELNDGLQKGHAYGFSVAESARLHAQSQHAIVEGGPSFGGYEEHMASISLRSLMR